MGEPVTTLIGTLALDAIASAAGIGSISGSVSIFGLSAAASAQVVGTAIVLAASVGASYGLMADAADQSMDKPEDTVRESLPPRFFPIGRTIVGGVIYEHQRTNLPGPTAMLLGKVISCAKIQLVETVLLNSTKELWAGRAPAQQDLPLDHQVPYTVASNFYNGFVRIEVGYGPPDQTASPLLTAPTDTAWDDTYRLRGLAYLNARYSQGADLTDHQKRYPNGAPQSAAVVHGVMLPDPRLGQNLADENTWTYSDNAALAVLRFLVSPDGWGLRPANINVASFITAANDCDDLVNGVRRYVAAGTWTTTDERKSTLDELLAACDGRLIEQADGTCKLIVGKHREPAITIEYADMLAAHFDRLGEPMDRVDQVKPRITTDEQGQKWNETEVPVVTWPVLDAASAPRVMDLPLKFVSGFAQARRLANAVMHMRNPEFRGTIRTTLSGLRAYGERIVRVRYPVLNIDRIFEVTSFALNVGDMTVSIGLNSVEATQWDTPA